MLDFCIVCRGRIRVMCFRGTRFCSTDCKKICDSGTLV